MSAVKLRKKAMVNPVYCASCGVCVKQCPIHAIHIINGVYAKVDSNKCVGCTKCTKVCPASTIYMTEKE